MNFNVANLPAVRAQIERDAAAARTAEQVSADTPAPIEYARAPTAAGPQQTGGRPAAVQGAAR